MRKTKIAVFASGGGTNLQALIDAQSSGIIRSGEISLVVSNNCSAYALERAQKAGIPTAVICRKDDPDSFDARVIDVLRQNEIDMIILAGYLVIFSSEITELYSGRIINVHPSLIPSFCGKGFYGLRVHEVALEYGVKVSGATVHYVNEVTDGGKIIMQKAVEVLDDDTPETLQKRIMEQCEWVILPLAAEKIAAKLAAEI